MITQIHKHELIPQFKTYLTQHGHSGRQITKEILSARRIIEFMDSKGFDYFDEKVASLYKEYVPDSDLAQWKKRQDLMTVRRMCEFLKGESPSIRPKKKNLKEFEDKDGDVKKRFLTYLREECMLSETTCIQYHKLLENFTEWQSISDVWLENLSLDDVLSFVGSSENAKYTRLLYLRKFLEFAYEQGYITQDFCEDLLLHTPPRKEKLPSYYTQKEVDTLEKSIDRSTEAGKRDYAIIILASRLGIRASDISLLEFSHLDFDTNQIVFKQYKTKEPNVLPILEDVGEALIDYIEKVRPEDVDTNRVFLTLTRPYRPISVAGISTVVAKRIYESGIEVKNRKTGAHSLRHSLSMAMLENEVKLPTISDVLGHVSTESTMYYIKIGVPNLLRCALDVPTVDDEFYMQKGGYFHE